MQSAIIERFNELWTNASTIWIAGGWAMIPIAVTAAVMFMVGVHVHLQLLRKRFHSVPEKVWRHWIDHPNKRKGNIGKMLDFAMGASSLKDTAMFFEDLRRKEIAPFERDLKVMKVCVNAAPLLGLLGTVTGMLVTFGALATGSGGEKTMELVSKGISEALITTETGLVIALPGVFFHYILLRNCEKYSAFLTHLETVCTQKVYKKLQKQKTV